MSELSIHKFSRKLTQKSVLPYLRDYILSREIPAPISINLDLTSACSYRCGYCIDKRVLNTGKMLDFGYVRKLLKEWKAGGLKSVIVIGGGEPTLHPRFEEIIKFIKKLNLQLGVVSNGTKLEKIKNICGLFEKNDWARFSLDAGTDRTFQKLHHPLLKITLEDILRGVREIRQKCPKIQLGYSFLIIGGGKYASNIKEINLAAKLAKESGFSYFSLKPIITPDSFRKTEISRKNLREIKKEIIKAKKLEAQNFRIAESVNLLCFFDEKLKKMMQRLPEICHIQHFRSIINPNGIFACSSWRGFDNLKVSENRRAADNFNAKKICRDMQCIYAPLNCWIDDLINNPEKIKKLKPIDDFNDYFF